MTDQEINEKPAKAVGFRPMLRNKSWPELWETPDGKNEIKLPDFHNDMNACLERIVPEIDKTEHGIVLSFKSGPSGTGCFLNRWYGQSDKQDDFACAFCLAALKYFEEMEK